MHPTGLPIFPTPAASSTRRTAAGVKAGRRSPAGLGLDAGEDRRTLTLAGATTQITCIMSMRVGARGSAVREMFAGRRSQSGPAMSMFGTTHSVPATIADYGGVRAVPQV